ncbi:MAG: hypothetical protein AAB686_03720, partial [Patescibacteria group bacterium]
MKKYTIFVSAISTLALTTALVVLVVSTVFAQTPATPPVPSIPSGSTSISSDTSYSYSTNLYADADGDQVKAIFDWGDSTLPTELNLTTPSSGGTSVSSSHSWAAAGNYSIRVKAKDATGLESGWSGSLAITVSASDTTPPSTPTGLTATAASSSQINLAWSAATDPSTGSGQVSGVAGYKIFRNGTFVYQTTALSYSDTGLSMNTTYSYYLKAVDAAGNESLPSVTLSATTPIFIAAPTNLTITLQTVTEKQATVYVRWTDNSNNETEFKMYRQLAGGTWSLVTTASVNSTLASNYITANGTYEYKVQACNSLGCSAEVGPASISITLPVPTSIPVAPTNLTITLQTVTEKQATVYVRWTDNSNNETEFKMYRQLAGGTWSLVTTASVNSTLASNYITANGTYEYKVQACNSLGCSAEVGPASISITLLAANIPAPSNAAVKIISISQDAQMSVSWIDNAENETEYRIHRRLAGGAWSQVKVVGAVSGGTASASDVLISSGTYEYKVQACNLLGCSADSNVASIIVAFPVTSTPAAPSNVAVKITTLTDTGASISASWSDNSDNESSFKLYRRLTGYTWFEARSTGSGSGTTYSASDSVTASGTYEYKVQACNSLGCSADSNIATISIILQTPTISTSTPAAPTNLTVKISSISETGASISASWSDNSDNESSFKLYRRLTGYTWFEARSTGSGSGTTYSASDSVTASGTYEYKVQACNSLGCSADSNIATISVTLPIPTTIPAVPSNVAAKITTLAETEARISVSWTDNADNETEFRIHRRLAGGTWFQVTTTGAGSGTSRSVSDTITVAGTFEYKIQACNTLGCSEFSAIGSVTVTSLPEPTAPTQISGNCLAPGNIYTITWDISGVSNVDKWVLRYTLDNGASFAIIAELPANTSSYGWKTPNIESNQVKVEVQAWSPAPNASLIATGISETLLTISSSCGATAITITLPTPLTIPNTPSNL